LCPVSHIFKVKEADLASYLQVEGTQSKKILNLVASLKENISNPNDFRRNFFHFLKNEKFKYSLTPTSLHGNRSLEEFLFQSKEGFCEHYAAAFATLARLAGIPSRIITGFQGGDYNPYGSFWIISYRDAHAWVELWDEKQGWVRVDPTTAIAPHRAVLNVMDKYHLENTLMVVDAFFFWIRGLFDNRDTLISLDDLTLDPFHLGALIFVLLCWLQVRRLNQDYKGTVQKLFLKVALLLDEKTIRRERSEGYENYRQRLLKWAEGQKNMKPLGPLMDRVFTRFIKLKYSAIGLPPQELRVLHNELKVLRRALKLKTNFISQLLRRVP